MRIGPLLILLLITAKCSAGIVLDRPPTHLGGGASDTDFINDSGQQHFQQVADDVLLSSSAAIRRIIWWGFYGGNFTFPPEPPPLSETVRVRWYEPRQSDGLPGRILAEETILNPSRAPTGLTIGGGPLGTPEYQFQIDLTTPFGAEANTPYWMEVVQIRDPQSAFRWEWSHAGGTGIAFVNTTTGDWRPLANANVAFQLSTVPEPKSVFILLSGFVLLTRDPRKERQN